MPKPSRIHLSTAILLMLLSAVLLLLNTRPKTQTYSYKGAEMVTATLHGWPFIFSRDLGKNPVGHKYRTISWVMDQESRNSISYNAVMNVEAFFKVSMLLANVLVAVLLLTILAVASERWIRRKRPE